MHGSMFTLYTKDFIQVNQPPQGLTFHKLVFGLVSQVAVSLR